MNYTKKSGFVTIAGRANVGKSTLLNLLVGEKVAIVSHRPQTTRNSITGILNTDTAQIVFVDTPGMHKPKTKLSEFMVKNIKEALTDTDIVLFVVEPKNSASEIDLSLLESFKASGQQVILIINKTDTISATEVAELITTFNSLFDFASIIPTSAKGGKDRELIISEIEKLLLPGAIFFPEDMITDQPEKQIAAEIIREKALKSLSDEIPHGIAVEIESFKEREESDILDISAVIYCERQSHKGIIIGKNGKMLKLIGSRAREDMERFFDCRVNLQCWVKDKGDWRNNDRMLKNFGYTNQ
ncbi:MAG: GTPase Era [Ruminococcaceae bacterium]|nr:GTPase Era [Oscillospiraceae bacterium]